MAIQEECMAKLRFFGYYAEELKYSRKDFEEDYKNSISLSPDFQIDVKKDPEDFHKANVFISVEFKDEDNPKLPFYLFAKIRGFFETTPETTEDKSNAMYEVNATAILFPYLRAVVTGLTSGNDHPPVILPAMNIKQYMEYKKKDIK